jgi:hypothetical protein
MTAEVGAELDAQLVFAGQIGKACGAAVAGALLSREPQPAYPPGVAFWDSHFVVLTTGAPALGNSIGPLLGWAWRVTRISIVGAAAGAYTVYRERGLGPQDQILPPAGVTFSPNGTYEPGRLIARYPYQFNAVGAGVTTAGLLVVDFWNIREDWLSTVAS